MGKNSIKDSVDVIANDLVINKPYHNGEKMILTNMQTYSSNLSLDSPKKGYRGSTFAKNEGDDSPRKSKFVSKNEDDSLCNTDMMRKSSMFSPSELHKLAIINNMKDKMPKEEMDVPDENSPLQSSIKKYGSLSAKTKNN